MADWYPRAQVVRATRDAGSFVGGGHKILWHSTEGSTAAGAVSAYRSTGSWPHFTATFENGTFQVFQHIGLARAGRALQHPAGTPETNRANVIQIEIVGFSAKALAWPPGLYAGLAELARWIEQNFKVPATCGVVFAPAGRAKRLSGSAFVSYAGHIGHEHAPGNDHTDPGQFRIDLILAKAKPAVANKTKARWRTNVKVFERVLAAHPEWPVGKRQALQWVRDKYRNALRKAG